MAQLKDLIVAGSARLLGKTYFEDTVTINDTLEVDAIKADSVITPSLNSDGTSVIIGGNLSLTTAGKYVTIGDGNASYSTSTGVLRVNGGIGVSKASYFDAALIANGALTGNSTLTITGATTLKSTLAVTGAITGSSTITTSGAGQVGNTFTIKNTSSGDTTLIFDRANNANWKLLNTGGVLKFQCDWSSSKKGDYYSALELNHGNKQATFYGNIIPSPNATLNLGSSSQKWKTLYVGNGDDAISTSTGVIQVTGGIGVTEAGYFGGDITADQLHITNDSGVGHITFARGGYNYLQAKKAGGIIAFVVNGQNVGYEASEMIISDGEIFPGTSAVTNLGSTSKRWKGVYSGTGNFSDNLTVAKDATIGNGTKSSSMDTGALIVTGGVGVTKQLNAKTVRIDNSVYFQYNSNDKSLDVIFG